MMLDFFILIFFNFHIFIDMTNSLHHKILDIKLVKIQKTFNRNLPVKYFYNLQLENFEEPILFEIEETLDNSLIGKSIKYHLDENYEVSEFEII